MNGIGKVTHNAVSNDQYFKNLDDHFEQFSSFFKEDDERMFVVFQEAAENTKVLADLCDFKIELGKLRLPKYEMSETLSKSFNSNEDLFFDIRQRNISNKVPENKLDEYLSRLEIEVDVISRGGFIDYFLILWDIVEWCKEQGVCRLPLWMILTCSTYVHPSRLHHTGLKSCTGSPPSLLS